MKLKLFGTSFALELYGTIKPEEYPPMNGQIIKALRYMVFNIHGDNMLENPTDKSGYRKLTDCVPCTATQVPA